MAARETTGNTTLTYLHRLHRGKTTNAEYVFLPAHGHFSAFLSESLTLTENEKLWETFQL